MEMHYCWRCKKELPFLHEFEFGIIASVLGISADVYFSPIENDDEIALLKRIPVDIFESITGYRLQCRSDIHHHRLSNFGEQCEGCGHLLRTPKASFCANCGLNASTSTDINEAAT
jgi:hypothetical protein